MSAYSDALRDAAESARLEALSSMGPLWAAAHGVRGLQSLVASSDPGRDRVSVEVVPQGSFATYGDGGPQLSEAVRSLSGAASYFTAGGRMLVSAAGDGVSDEGPAARADYRELGAGGWNPLSAACARALAANRGRIRSALLADAVDRRVR